jgi:hypothetical protein
MKRKKEASKREKATSKRKKATTVKSCPYRRTS